MQSVHYTTGECYYTHTCDIYISVTNSFIFGKERKNIQKPIKTIKKFNQSLKRKKKQKTHLLTEQPAKLGTISFADEVDNVVHRPVEGIGFNIYIEFFIIFLFHRNIFLFFLLFLFFFLLFIFLLFLFLLLLFFFLFWYWNICLLQSREREREKKIILISQKYLVWDYSKWWKIRVLWAWTEVCHQIFAEWKMQTIWNLQNCGVYRKACFSKGGKKMRFTNELLVLPQSARVEKKPWLL